MDQSQEAELVAAAQMGDRDAFLELARYYQRPMYRLIHAMSPAADNAVGLAQDVFARAWREIAEYPTGRRFFPWLIRIARSLPASAPSRAAVPGRDDSLLAGIEALRSDDRLALALRVVERVRYREIAALLDVPLGIVFLRVAQARGQLLASTSGSGRRES